jgi:hypothetical protein
MIQKKLLAKYLIISLLIIHLIPIWTFKFIPTQDGINHVYNAYVLKEYNNTQYTQYRQVYDLNIKPFPNWTSHVFFYLALYIMPPLVAEKIFVTICVLLVPLSFFYFFNSVEKRLWFFGFLGFLYSYNLLLHLGFYNFSISVPLYFFLIGYWWKHRSQLNWKHGLIINVMLMVIYFSHLFSFALSIFSIALLTLTSALLSWDKPKRLKERVFILLRSAVCLIPSCIVLLICILINPEEKTVSYKPFKELLEFFVSIKSLVYYNDRYRIVSWVLLGFLCVCIILTIFVKFWSLFKKEKYKIYRIFLDQRAGFFFLFVVITVLFFKIPWAYGPPAWLNDRANLFIFPVLTAWFAFSYPKWIKVGMVAIIIVLSLAHLGLTIFDYNLLNKDMKEFTAGAGLIKDDSSISIIPTTDFFYAPNHGTLKYTSPFTHDTCYYCFGNGSHYVGNYEPKYSYFPLHYKTGYWKFEYKGTIDYMIVWHFDDNSPEVIELKKDYDMIFSTDNMKLFKHKPVK